MKKRTTIFTTMMGMCMWTCSMCKTFGAYFSDVLSISRVSYCAA